MGGLFLNYIGLARLYSLSDLVLLLVAAGLTGARFWAGLGLWLGFLAYLESRHAHPGRAGVPWIVAVILWIPSAYYFGVPWGSAFIALSLLYTAKKHRWWGLVSPIARGLQTLVLVAAGLGFGWFALAAAAATAVRNALGDFRDVEHDREEGLKTWPVVLGIRTNWHYLHLVAVLTTTYLWWWKSGISILWLTIVWAVQLATYWVTPRISNPKRH